MSRTFAALVTVAAVATVAGCSGAGSPAAAPAPNLSTTRTSASPSTVATVRHPAHTRAPSPSPSPIPTPRPTRRYVAKPHYVYPVQGCRSSYSSSHHDYPASDVFTQKGCHFVAVTSGRVDEVSYVDRWNPQVDAGGTRGGLSVSIIGDDGVRYYGSHLEKIAAGIEPGARVRAGQLLGLIDNTGDAKYVPTHVHFGISWPTRHGVWWVRRGMIWPQRYLASWLAGGNLSPVREVRALHRRMGNVPRCQAEC